MLHHLTGESPLPARRIRVRGPRMLQTANALGCVQVLDVPPMTRRNKQVLITIQVDVEKYRLPRPTRARKPREFRNLREGPIASTPVTAVPHHLRPILREVDPDRQTRLGDGLTTPHTRIRIHHVDHQEVEVPIAVEIREVHAHGILTRVTEGTTRSETETARTNTHPQPVGGRIVVAHIQVGPPIPVHIAERRAQPPVPRR